MHHLPHVPTVVCACEDSKVGIDRENVVALKKAVIGGSKKQNVYLELVYLVAALVPSDTQHALPALQAEADAR